MTKLTPEQVYNIMLTLIDITWETGDHSVVGWYVYQNSVVTCSGDGCPFFKDGSTIKLCSCPERTLYPKTGLGLIMFLKDYSSDPVEVLPSGGIKVHKDILEGSDVEPEDIDCPEKLRHRAGLFETMCQEQM